MEVTNNDITNLALIFSIKEKGNDKKRFYTTLPIVYYRVDSANNTEIIGGIGSEGIIGIENGQHAYVGKLIVNSLNKNNAPLKQLFLLAKKAGHNISTYKIKNIPPVDLFIIPKDDSIGRLYSTTKIANIKFKTMSDEQGIQTPGRYFKYTFVASDYYPLRLGGNSE